MKIPVLDHGYIEFIEAWGKGRDAEQSEYKDLYYDYERGIIEAARQSTQGSFRGWTETPCTCGLPERKLGETHAEDCKYKPGDSKLLNFLFTNNHSTPFEFAGLVIEVQAPIFVFREWHRHRTQSYNEMSARYEPLPDLYYVPTKDRIVGNRIQPANKQASSTTIPAGEFEAREWLVELQSFYKESEVLYKAALDSGIPKELARLSMPVGHYSRMRASANLRNWLSFMTLRADPKAQWEIRQFAEALGSILVTTFPRTMKLFVDRLVD